LDAKILQFKKIENIVLPSSGWVYAIRQALGMSLRQVGNKMGITPQSVKEIEEREQNETISMKLEDQENNPARIQKAIKEKANEIKMEMPKYLWD
jgi:transcriptional regulator with XRE-family HTH domain